MTSRSRWSDRATPISKVGGMVGTDYLLEPCLFPTSGATLIAGKPGASKTMVAIDLAARITTGRLGGDLLGKPQPVLYLSYENDRRANIAPRFEAAKGNGDLFAVYNGEFELPNDTADLTAEIRRAKPALVIIDGLLDYIDQSYNQQANTQKTTKALRPLEEMAISQGVAVLGILWRVKGRSTGLDSIVGSVATTGVVSQVVIIGELPSQEHVLGSIKNRVGPDYKGWKYNWDVIEVGKDARPGHEAKAITAPVIRWGLPAKKKEIVMAQKQNEGSENERIMWLLELLQPDKVDAPQPTWPWFITSDLLDQIMEEWDVGKRTAHQDIADAVAAGWIKRKASGRRATFKNEIQITADGLAALDAEDEVVENYTQKVFPDAPVKTRARPKPKQP